MFLPARGLDHQDFLDALHHQLRFDWYLEIGTETGRSLAASYSPSVAVDPLFQIRQDIAAHKAQLHLFQETSDAFFAEGRLRALGIKPSFTLLDGLHLFEQLLRDLIETEAAGTRASVVVIPNCCPYDHGMTTRDLMNLPKGPWAGDVWKLIPILQDYRPDLSLQILDCAPTGLALLSGLDPDNTVLRQNYNRIVSQYRDMTLETFGTDRFFTAFQYHSAQAERDAGFPGARPAAKSAYVPAKVAGAEPPPRTEGVQRALECRTVHGIDLYATHETLRDVARDLSAGLTRPLSRPVDVYVGILGAVEPVPTGRFRIGIQTEHFFDAAGQRMWLMPRPRAIRRFVSGYDRILDLSPSNRPAYDMLDPDQRAKISFGPHIFPDSPVAPDFKPTPPLFFGSLNTRRHVILRRLQMQRPLGIAPRWTFGDDLNQLIAAHGTVLNLHYVEGLYTEYPRLLKAYLRGKPLQSEPLAPPLDAGTHYFDLKAEPTEDQTLAVFANLTAFAARHSFQTYLETTLAAFSPGGAG